MTFEQLMLLLTMIGTGLTAIATVGLVIGAFMAWQVAKENLRHLREDSRAQTRPYVYAKIVPSIGGPRAWDLIIQNSGRSSATDLTIEVSAWPETDELTKALHTLFSTPQTLPPGTTIRTYWQLGPRGEQGSSGSTGFDIPVDLTVKYKSSDSDAPPYSETFHVDPTTLGMTPMGRSGVNLGHDATPVEKKLKEIVESLNELRRGE